MLTEGENTHSGIDETLSPSVKTFRFATSLTEGGKGIDVSQHSSQTCDGQIATARCASQ